MRIMYSSNNIVEFHEINLVKGWNPTEGGSEDNPSDMYLYIDDEMVGEYQLEDASNAKKAVENIDSICEKLLINGYCRATDFENFIWY